MKVTLLLFVPFFLLGFAVRRWWVAILPLVGWPLDAYAREAGWWGNGHGDLWLELTVFFTLVGVAGALIGVKARRELDRRRRRASA